MAAKNGDVLVANWGARRQEKPEGATVFPEGLMDEIMMYVCDEICSEIDDYVWNMLENDI